jgi:hypothetical protein
VSPHNQSGGVKTYGIYWDEPTQTLFYGHGREYNTREPFLPSIGAATLDPEKGIVNRGIWGLSNRSTKMIHGGLTAIPEWFASRYTKGRRLGAGFGGYYSIAATGPISMGPALTAFDPAVLLAAPDRSAKTPHTPLVGYPLVAAPYRTDRAHRDTDVINDYDGWKPKNGIGYWTWNDTLYQAGVWIDTPTKSGLLFAPTLGNGRGWYFGSTLHAERGSHAWMIYDTADLALVARGKKAEWQIQPSFDIVQYPGLTYPLHRWAGAPGVRVLGISYDERTQRLYVGLRIGQRTPLRIYVYDVQ